MKTEITLLLMTLLTVNVVMAQERQYEKFTGKIGSYAITLFMSQDDLSEGATVGYYYYDERPKTHFKLVLKEYEVINTKGSMHFVLKEYTPKGNHTGTFDGQLEGRGGSFEGTFTNRKGEKFHFELMEEY